jgi:hypothetical protein
MVDVAGISAFIVWISKNLQWNDGKRHRRRLFLLQLSHDLVNDHLNRRRQQPQAMQRNVRLALQAIGLPLTTPLPDDTIPISGIKQRCRLCSRGRDRKVITHCASCHASCCPDHHKVICDTCYDTFTE